VNLEETRSNASSFKHNLNRNASLDTHDARLLIAAPINLLVDAQANSAYLTIPGPNQAGKIPRKKDPLFKPAYMDHTPAPSPSTTPLPG
jgi:hypothetical protein